MTIDWGTLSAIVVIAVMGGGAIVAAGRHVLRGWFVGQDQHDKLATRIDAVEERLASLPPHQEISEFARRLNGVEVNVAVVRTEVEGVGAGMKRVERTVDQLLRHQLEKGQ